MIQNVHVFSISHTYVSKKVFVKVDLVSFVKPKMKDLDRSISLKHDINELLPQGQRPTDELNVWSWA